MFAGESLFGTWAAFFPDFADPPVVIKRIVVGAHLRLVFFKPKAETVMGFAGRKPNLNSVTFVQGESFDGRTLVTFDGGRLLTYLDRESTVHHLRSFPSGRLLVF